MEVLLQNDEIACFQQNAAQNGRQSWSKDYFSTY
jgi:hypothetical protein